MFIGKKRYVYVKKEKKSYVYWEKDVMYVGKKSLVNTIHFEGKFNPWYSFYLGHENFPLPLANTVFMINNDGLIFYNNHRKYYKLFEVSLNFSNSKIGSR